MARVAPRAAVDAKVEAAAACSHPDLAVGRVTIHDQLASVIALDREDAVVEAPVEIDVAVVQRRIERATDARERSIGGVEELGIGHFARACGGVEVLASP